MVRSMESLCTALNCANIGEGMCINVFHCVVVCECFPKITDNYHPQALLLLLADYSIVPWVNRTHFWFQIIIIDGLFKLMAMVFINC